MATIVLVMLVPITLQPFAAYTLAYEIYSVGEVKVVPSVSTVTGPAGAVRGTVLFVPFAIAVCGQYISWTYGRKAERLATLHPNIQSIRYSLCLPSLHSVRSLACSLVLPWLNWLAI